MHLFDICKKTSITEITSSLEISLKSDLTRVSCIERAISESSACIHNSPASTMDERSTSISNRLSPCPQQRMLSNYKHRQIHTRDQLSLAIPPGVNAIRINSRGVYHFPPFIAYTLVLCLKTTIRTTISSPCSE